MVWRLPTSVWRQQKGSSNRKALGKIVREGPPPGVLAYRQDHPIAWCSVAPRESFVYLARSRVLRPIDATPVWSISCLFVRREERKRGVATALLRAAADFAFKHGAQVIEGYPIIPYTAAMPATFAWTGTLNSFLAAGFSEVGRGSPKRPIVRCYRKASRG